MSDHLKSLYEFNDVIGEILSENTETDPNEIKSKEEHKELFQKHLNRPLTKHESDAVGDYTSEGAMSLNKKLHNKEKIEPHERRHPYIPTHHEVLTHMDRLTKEGKLHRDVTLYRGLKTDHEVKHLKHGDVLHHSAFVDTSTKKSVAKNFKNNVDPYERPEGKKSMMIIHAKKGQSAFIPGHHASIARTNYNTVLERKHDREQGVILHRHTKLKYLHKDRHGHHFEIQEDK